MVGSVFGFYENFTHPKIHVNGYLEYLKEKKMPKTQQPKEEKWICEISIKKELKLIIFH